MKAAEMAKSKYGDFDVVLIGPKVDCDLEVVEAEDAEDGHKKMVELLEKKQIGWLCNSTF
ncbi:glycine reductase complex component C, alpha subunit [Clostridium carboxidivorans P7]|uniref:Glycine reductase complex component C, alpha subunit n=1 Tax=Clostridium carboxidivorans P7 TaxID=536227 RepID=C6PSB1_9CLOT|nr:glycine reductase complex component C, alpha subunit [Clostridium carboxidivorans P7]